MEHFVTTVIGFQPLTIITKRSILDVAVALDPPLLDWLAASPFNNQIGLKLKLSYIPALADI